MKDSLPNVPNYKPKSETRPSTQVSDRTNHQLTLFYEEGRQIMTPSFCVLELELLPIARNSSVGS